jgi:Skp family chaperone for outer membrane proteins
MKKLSLLGLLFIFIGLEAQAQVNIGYTSFDELFVESPQYESLANEISISVAELDTLTKQRLKYYQDLAVGFQVQNLTQNQFQSKVDSLEKLFQGEIKAESKKLEDKRRALTLGLENKIQSAINTVSDSLGLDLVFNIGSLNSGLFIPYKSEDQVDITEMVLNKLKTL